MEPNNGKRLKAAGMAALALLSVGLYGYRSERGDRYTQREPVDVQPIVEETEAEPAAEAEWVINLNTATNEELQLLPGIGPVKAEAILEYRRKAGSFIAIEEITNVKGIGEKTFEKIKGFLCVQ